MTEITESNDWKWQIANRISTREQLEEYIDLTDDERAAFDGDIPLSFAVTPHYAALLKSDALRKTVIPTDAENNVGTGELADPLGEEDHRATPHLIHTYPDKVLFLATTFCSTYCRYCTRSRMVGKPQINLEGRVPPRPPSDHVEGPIPPCPPSDQSEQKLQSSGVDILVCPSSAAEMRRQESLRHTIEQSPTLQKYAETFQYIEQHPEIRDVLISGGDPLTMTDSVLDELLSRLRNIPHVRMVRIGSKVPVVLPQRITDELCSILRKHRVWLSLHFIHAAELSPETQAACQKLSDHGIGMVSQTVLLKGINDDTQSLVDLFYGLLEINVKPYYLLQCDPVQGSEHFRTTVEQGIELIQSLHGNISGLAVPQYVIDAPGGGGKVPILSKEQIRRQGDDVVFLNYLGKEYRYPDPDIS